MIEDEDLDKFWIVRKGAMFKSNAKDIKKHIRENVRDNSFPHRLWIQYKRKLKPLLTRNAIVTSMEK